MEAGGDNSITLFRIALFIIADMLDFGLLLASNSFRNDSKLIPTPGFDTEKVKVDVGT